MSAKQNHQPCVRPVYLGLGSNIGDRAAWIQKALQHIAALHSVRVKKISSLYETEPWGKTDQSPFLNAVAMFETSRPLLDVLADLQHIEKKLGRVRKEKWGPRCIDLDLLVAEGEEMQTEVLTLPHPYLTVRRFVLCPFAEIAPDVVVHGETITTWLARLEDKEGTGGIRRLHKKIVTHS